MSAFGVAWLALRQIGGQTGDVLGGAEQVAEISADPAKLNAVVQAIQDQDIYKAIEILADRTPFDDTLDGIINPVYPYKATVFIDANTSLAAAKLQALRENKILIETSNGGTCARRSPTPCRGTRAMDSGTAGGAERAAGDAGRAPARHHAGSAGQIAPGVCGAR